jgi:phosphatidylinositol alpha-1,6-mannosyltransferase
MAGAALRSVRRHRPALIACGHVVAAPLGLALSRLLRVPFVVFGYAMELRAPRSARIARFAAPGADAFVCISRFTAGEALRLGVHPDRLLLTAMGVEPTLLDASAPPGEQAGVQAGGHAGRTLLTVARLREPYKGHDNVLRALPLIAERVPDVRYVVVGDGPLRPRLEALADELGVRPRVDFAGAVPDAELRRRYRECDVFVMPSREEPSGGAEGFGIVFLEANAAGKPVVGGRSGGTPDAVLDGVTGLLVDPTSVPEIAAACTRLLADPEVAGRLGAQGRRRVESELVWPRVIARLEGALLDVAAGRPVPAAFAPRATGLAW